MALTAVEIKAIVSGVLEALPLHIPNIVATSEEINAHIRGIAVEAAKAVIDEEFPPQEEGQEAPSNISAAVAAAMGAPPPSPVGILGKAMPTAAPASADEPPATAGTTEAADPMATLISLGQKTQQSREEFYARRGEAINSLFNAVADQKLWFVDEVQLGTTVVKPFVWLGTRIVNSDMSLEQAVQYAIDNEWVFEVTTDPRKYKELMNAIRAQGLRLRKRQRVNGDFVDVSIPLVQALETGVPVTDLVDLAMKNGWTEPAREAPDTSIGAHLREKEEIAAEQEANAALPGKSTGNDGKSRTDRGKPKRKH